MFTATVPLDSGAWPDLRSGTESVHLLDSDPSAQITLPCRVHDPDLWFAEVPAELERAKQLCRGCPIKVDCLASALSRQEPWGVWGGEILERGVVIARKRPRGRPRKADLERDRAERNGAERELDHVEHDGAERNRVEYHSVLRNSPSRNGSPHNSPLPNGADRDAAA